MAVRSETGAPPVARTQGPGARTSGSETEPLGHRDRLIAAMAESIEEKGYRDTTVADVVRLARTSRRNFYEHFEDRDRCFLALFDATNHSMMASVAHAVSPQRSLDDQIYGAVDAYISHVTARPALYGSFIRELPGLGDAGAERGQATLVAFAEMLVGIVDDGRRVQPGVLSHGLTMDTAIIIVGGLRELLVLALTQGRDMTDLRSSVGDTVKAILTSP